MTDATISSSIEDARPAMPARGKRAARLALAAIVAACAGGGWYGYQRIHGTAGIPMAAAGDFLPDATGTGPRGGFGGARPPRPGGPPAAGVSVLPGKVVIARAAGLVLRANGRPDGTWSITCNRPGAGDRQAIELLNQTRRRILEPRRPQADLKVTDAQRAALATIVPDAPAELAPDAYARVVALLGQLTKLVPTDPKAEPMKAELLQLVAAAAKADAGAVAQQYAARANAIRGTLSAGQVQSLLDQRPAAATATKPVAK